MALVGLAVFLIRFQHAGPYGFPEGGNLVAALLCFVLAALLYAKPSPAPIRWLALLASPVVLFFALYATLAELEEVIVLQARTTDGARSDLRLWVVDHDGAAWVTMPREKGDAHRLDGEPVRMLRDGAFSCVVPRRFEDRENTRRSFELRMEKYAIQRLAVAIGIFDPDVNDGNITYRLDPCEAAAG